MTSDTFEAAIRRLTVPLNGQFPRPWMTRLQDPQQAKTFIVGRNQRHGYDIAVVGSHENHMNALFNRQGATCRGLYNRITGGKASPTRQHTDELTARLEARGVTSILETNVICYSTPMSADLSSAVHRGGRQKGSEIFQFLLDAIRPAVIIAHGSGTRTALAKTLKQALPDVPGTPGAVVSTGVSAGDHFMTVFVIPSLAPPEYNSWCGWASGYLDRLSDTVAARLQ